MKKLLKSVAALSLSAMMLLSPGVLAEEDEEESNVVELTTVVQEYEGKQIVLKTAGLDILEQDGYKFKDLNKNGELDPYEDWRLTPEERTEDLLSRMSDKNKAAQMAHMTLVTLKESWFSDLDIGFALTYTYFAESKESAGEKMNYVQSLCEESELGIPVVFSMDSVIGASWINDTTILPDAITLGATGDDFNPRSPHGERQRKVTILSIRIIDFAQKVYHKTVLLRISLAENAVILPEKPRNPVRTSLQKAGGLRFARAIRAARPYSISSPSGA